MTIKREDITMVLREIRNLSTFFLISSFATNVYSQDTIVLGSAECAVVKFHICDDCPCSYVTFEKIDGQLANLCFVSASIDSVLFFNIADDFMNEEYLLNDIDYLFIPDTLKLRKDTSYIASITVGFEMNYTILVELYGENLVYERNCYGRLADFIRVRDLGSTNFKHWNIIKRSIDECDSKYELYAPCNSSD